jgi:hypothetical protein
MLQYLPAFELPHGNASFGERRLPEIAPLGHVSFWLLSLYEFNIKHNTVGVQLG